MSALAWIDFDETERQRAQRILELFDEKETRDELGLGAIRDSIADTLFPGTSTIQTRLRYMLFVPWLFRRLEGRGLPGARLREEARALEVRLVEALRAGGETNGVIGLRAGGALQRLPSVVYWAGLGAWGVRLAQGSVESLFAELARDRRRRLSGEAEGEGVSPIWSPSLPPPPDDLAERAIFRLSVEEAEFLRDRLTAAQPDALLTWLAREGDDSRCEEIWAHPRLAHFPAAARRLVEHAERFSAAMHGASLVYNLALAERRGHEEWVTRYSDRLARWREETDLPALRAWPIDEFWVVAEHPGHRVQTLSKRFVETWLALVLSTGGAVAEAPAARRMVEERETRLKGAQSRFRNRAVLDRWSGASGTARLTFRWPEASSHLRDLAHAA